MTLDRNSLLSVLVISQTQVRRLLSMETCIELMADALGTLGRGEAVNPLRWGMRLPEGLGILGLMPGQVSCPPALGLKIVSIFPRNEGTPYDSHQGVVVLFDPERGFPIAILDASELTAVRTAAVSALATRLLARDDASDLAILGSGVQARTHLTGMRAVREIRRVRAWSPTGERLRAFATTESERHGIEVEACGSAAEAVERADIVCTVTSAHEPILKGAWLTPGAHVNAVGSSVATARELDTEAVRKARLFVDCRESALAEAGDFLIPKGEGAIADDHVVGEIGEILLGRLAGRETPGELTLFKSLGLAVEDLVAASYLVERAREEGVGTTVEIGKLPGAPA